MNIPPTPIADPELLRQAMRRWVAGVTIVTSAFEGVMHGMTVSSFTSISATPPMILISLDRTTRTHALIQQSGFFGVTLLGAHQQEISDRFAGRIGPEEGRFLGLETFSLVSTAPLIRGGIAYFDCKVVSTQPAGTSTVFFADVMAALPAETEEPLVYTNRDYYRLQK